eukprot:scaffold62917_cov58-Phaeocystis_antarctica.AAC.4
MSVTLDVSKLSSWLNADASCQVERRAYDVGRGAGREARGRCGGGGASSVQAEPLTGGVGAQEIGEAHVKHALHGCDAGRVEAQLLVERRCFLPSRKEGIRCGMWWGPGGERALRWRRRKQRARGRDRLEWLGRRARGGAYREHVAHVCDAGRVEAQRLVELIRVLPSRKEAIPLGASCGPEGGRAVRWRRREQRAGRRVGLHAMERTLNM